MNRIIITILSLFFGPSALPIDLTISVQTKDTSTVKSNHAYWIWAGHEIKATHSGAVLYLHQGHVHNIKNNARAFVKLGFSPYKINAWSLYIVIRMNKLLRDKQYIFALARLMKRWEARGNKVEGLQLDFDSATLKLLKYSNYLRFVRANLPQKYKLSITGLGDWLVNGQQQHLLDIGRSVDEIVFQLYQHKTAYKNLMPYFMSLKTSGLPFKLGLVQRGKYNKAQLERLTRLPNYRGSVIFTIH